MSSNSAIIEITNPLGFQKVSTSDPDLPAVDGAAAANCHSQQKMKPLQCVVTIVKCAVGGGSFVLPYAFEQGGLYASFIFIGFLGAITAYTIHLLVLSAQKIDELRKLTSGATGLSKPISYASLSAVAFPNLTCRIGSLGEINMVSVLTHFGIVFTCIGVCSAYLNFIVSTLQSLAVASSWETPRALIIAILLPFMLCLAVLRSFRLLFFSSVMGDVAVTAGMLAVIVYGATEGSNITLSHPFLHVETFPLFFGNAAFLFSIHVCMIPIANDTEDKSKMSTNIAWAFGIITAINALFGSLAYILYSDSSCSSDNLGPCRNVIDNIQSTASHFVAAKLFLCLDLFLTIPVVLTAAHETTNEILANRLISAMKSHAPAAAEYIGDTSVTLISHLILRFSLILCVVFVSLILAEFGSLVDIVGGVLNSIMGYMLPPLIYLKLFGQNISLASYIINCLLVFYGLIVIVITFIHATAD
jgi:amino acid permease